MPKYNSLRLPHAPTWEREVGYSPTAAEALTKAYASITSSRDGEDAYLRAYSCIFPFSTARISLRQRLHLVYILAVVYAEVGEHEKAVGCLDEALELSIRLDSVDAPIELFYLRGSLFRRNSHYFRAVTDFADCLELLKETIIERNRAADIAFMAHVLVDMASAHFFLAHYSQTEQCLQEASALRPQGPHDLALDANRLWSRALLDRQRGDFVPALASAKATRDLYAELNSPMSEVRIHFLCGEISLDLAQKYPVASGPAEAYLDLARSCSEQAAKVVHGIHDPAGEGLALLLRARLSMTTGALTDDEFKLTQAAIKKASQLNDPALLCQAYSTLGIQQTARGEHLGASNSFRMVLDVANANMLPALAAPAQRFFEMSVQ